MLQRVFVISAALLFLISFLACSAKEESIPTKVCFAEQCIDVEIAQTSEERTKGLQHRKSLGKNKGMLFIFKSDKKYQFWMKDTFISLDMIWIDEHKRIVTVIANILPCQTQQCPVYTPDKDARYVLEVNAGVSAEMGLEVGDVAVFH